MTDDEMMSTWTALFLLLILLLLLYATHLACLCRHVRTCCSICCMCVRVCVCVCERANGRATLQRFVISFHFCSVLFACCDCNYLQRQNTHKSENSVLLLRLLLYDEFGWHASPAHSTYSTCSTQHGHIRRATRTTGTNSKKKNNANNNSNN